MIGVRKAAAPTRNPYVGPRPFRSGDTLHGRGRELRALRDVLIAERIVLLHSPSGAGKTSLIQASLTGALASKRFDVIGPLRVNAQPPNGEVNRYLWSVLLGLDGVSAEEAGGSVANALDLLDERDDAEGGRPRRRVLVLDQFEEVLTLVPTDRSGQEEFFRDIGRALEKDHRWALFSMREDYMGGLARFAVWIPTHLRVRCRLDFLEESAALDAVRNPAREREVEFTDEAARMMVADLAKVRVQVPGEDEPEDVAGPYVEPFQLQVVCTGLWQKLQQHERKFGRIEPEHVRKYADFEGAMSSYYAWAVADVANATGANERAIRDWFDDALITKQDFRRQSSTGPDAGADAGEVIAGLESSYLIRSEVRRGTTWYELAHDNLVGAVRRSNERWRQRHLNRWEWEADLWERSGRQSEYLLRGADVRAARQWLKQHQNGEHPVVRQFVDASAGEQGKTVAARMGKVAALYFWLALVELAVIVVLLAR
jgi:hypothetical protein